MTCLGAYVPVTVESGLPGNGNGQYNVLLSDRFTVTPKMWPVQADGLTSSVVGTQRDGVAGVCVH